jgi:hypothetical protein
VVAVALRIAAAVVAFSLAAAPRPAAAQTIVNTGDLFLASGAELELSLFGGDADGLNPAQNGPGASDRIDVEGQFNFSSAGTYTVGFSLGDAVPLTPGSTFTLVTFVSTNAAPAAASAFRAAPRGGRLTSIDGTFSLVPPGATGSGSRGSLQFTLSSAVEIPEPSAAALLAASGAAPVALSLRRRHRRRVSDACRGN